MAKTGVRVAITLACTDCKRRNYQTMKSKRNTPDRVEFQKFCRWCGTHTRIGRPASDADGARPPRQQPDAFRVLQTERRRGSNFIAGSWAELKKVEWPGRTR